MNPAPVMSEKPTAESELHSELERIQDPNDTECVKIALKLLWIRMALRYYHSYGQWYQCFEQYRSTVPGPAIPSIIRPVAFQHRKPPLNHHFKRIEFCVNCVPVILSNLYVLDKGIEPVTMYMCSLSESLDESQAPAHFFSIWNVAYKILHIMRAYGDRLIEKEDLVFLLSDTKQGGAHRGAVPVSPESGDAETIRSALKLIHKYNKPGARRIVYYYAQDSKFVFYQLM